MRGQRAGRVGLAREARNGESTGSRSTACSMGIFSKNGQRYPTVSTASRPLRSNPCQQRPVILPASRLSAPPIHCSVSRFSFLVPSRCAQALKSADRSAYMRVLSSRHRRREHFIIAQWPPLTQRRTDSNNLRASGNFTLLVDINSNRTYYGKSPSFPAYHDNVATLLPWFLLAPLIHAC
ncbi:hypothetical protein BC834DRAFT_295903 [Gloeopeniophorella convolvens]|nr:hypothetical protein BC834DRAFT_295903 [Gloeopeniophorella convolvens]